MPTLKFSSNDELWAVMVGARSYLIRGISGREYRDVRNPGPTKEFRVHTSAYIDGADGAIEGEALPVTFALIPLGKQAPGNTVGVLYSCATVSCRQVGFDANERRLLDVKLPGLHSTRYDNELCNGKYCQILEAGATP
jgi:hypothetical protein